MQLESITATSSSIGAGTEAASIRQKVAPGTPTAEFDHSKSIQARTEVLGGLFFCPSKSFRPDVISFRRFQLRIEHRLRGKLPLMH